MTASFSASERNAVWQTTRPHPPHWPQLDGDASARVVVAGGGLVGLLTALLLARRGITDVIVLERRTLGGGTTGGTTAKVTALHGASLAPLEKRAGVDAAMTYVQANLAGVDLIRSLVGELAIDCGLEASPTCTFAWDDDGHEALAREFEATVHAGLDTQLDGGDGLPFLVRSALWWTGGFHLHPLRLLDGLARHAADLGVRIYEHTPVTGIDDGADGVEVTTPHGKVRAGELVEATLLPFTNIGGFFAKAEPSRSYALAATIHGVPVEAMAISNASPIRSVRPVTIAGEVGIVASGPSHKPGSTADTASCAAELEEWVLSTFAVDRVVAAWSAQDYRTPDGVPFVGRSPRTDHVWVATGFHKWGFSNGGAAAMLLADQMTGATTPWAELFDAKRVLGFGALPALVKANLDVAKHAALDRLHRVHADDVGALAPESGGIVDVDGETVGAYRDGAGDLFLVHPTCTHLGCTLAFNDIERTWDCPCHGSRFDRDGAVLEGPALEPLTSVQLRAAPAGTTER